MTIQESEVQPSMMIQVDTGKHRAVCAALGVSVDSPADAVLDAVLKFTESAYRHTKGLFDGIPLSDEKIDGLIDTLMKRAGARRTKNKT